VLKGAHLTLMIGPTLPIVAPVSVVDALREVQVTTTAGQRSGFQLTFAAGKSSDLIRTLIPASYLDPRRRVIVVVTIAGVPHVLMDGVITRQDVAPSSEPGASQVTVTGEDLSLMMDLDDYSYVSFPGMAAEARVAMVLGKYAMYGMVPAVVPNPTFFDVPLPTERIPSQKGGMRARGAPCKGTDLAYIEALANENGYVFYIEPGPLPGMNIAYWGPEVRIGIPQPALTVNMDSETNVESLRFSYDGLSRKQLTMGIQEPFSKRRIPVPIPNISILRPPLALRPALALRSEPIDDVAKLNATQAAAYGLSKTAQSADAITAEGELDVTRYGHLLRARGLVGVRGGGLSYDGLYYVKRVSTRVRRGVITQSFTLTRDGLLPLTPVVPV
jgi:hypothetical protein